ncbi:MAG: MBOAT family protein [Alphaproteobacteria bacterium]|nr:MBOAT family protein [Alphaproteobacteria bacterium]
MLFNSTVFPLFFAVVYLLYRGLGRLPERPGLRAQNLLLLAASYFFYAWWDWRFLGLIVLSTAVDFLCGLGLSRPGLQRRWPLVLLSVLVNLGILATFKYAGFFVVEANRLLELSGLPHRYPAMEVLLPVGLSFYTFQSMAYTIDVYRRDTEATKDPVDFALFVSFFPQLVAGPIERSARLLPQLQRPRAITPQQLAEGGHLILWGFFKKLFVADNLAVIVDAVFAPGGSPSGPLVLIGAYAFTWQIYCDFSGYTDIARGLAKWLGIELSVNFRLPFFATSPQDIWRRWHVSLSQWLRDYLYIPLGGNRKGPWRTQANLLITMVLGGLWHGAAWTFIAWGAYHGLALAIQRALPPFRLPKLAATVLTFHFTALGFLIFRARDMAQVRSMLTAFLTDFSPDPDDRYALTQLVVLIAVPLAVELAEHLKGDDLDWIMRWPRWAQALAAAGMLYAIVVLGASAGQRFIYFQF